jgi:hypothetical protein
MDPSGHHEKIAQSHSDRSRDAGAGHAELK